MSEMGQGELMGSICSTRIPFILIVTSQSHLSPLSKSYSPNPLVDPKTHFGTVIGHYFCSYFSSIFDPTSLHIPYPTPFLPYVYLEYVHSSMLLCLHAHEQTTRTQFNWYNRTPNNSTTGLPTFRNSPVMLLPHPDPVREPLLPPPNAPTTQSSGLPKLGARVGVRPSREYSW